jgi:hypothetical protein
MGSNFWKLLVIITMIGYRKSFLNLKGPFGVTNLKVCSQKIVPIFSFFFVWAGTLWALVTSLSRVLKEARPYFEAGKTSVFSGKLKSQFE